MRDELVIGKGNQGNSAIHVMEVAGDHSISQNKVSFWISKCIFDQRITIFKDTPEGKRLQGLIEQGASLKKIQGWLDNLVLSKLSPIKLKQLIERSNMEAFECGKRAKAAELRAVLELDRSFY